MAKRPSSGGPDARAVEKPRRRRGPPAGAATEGGKSPATETPARGAARGSPGRRGVKADGLPKPENIVAYLRSVGRRPHKPGMLRDQFGVGQEKKGEFRQLLRDMEKQGFIRTVKGNRYVARTEQEMQARQAPGAGMVSAPGGARPIGPGAVRREGRRPARGGWAREQPAFPEVSRRFFKENRLPPSYPRHALKDALAYGEPVPELFPARRDLRHWEIFTIDPASARDHDDAISLERKEGGNWLLGVHIADVSEYVKPDGPLDHEALRRAFTQYLPWTSVPMLPEHLSGGLCSLKEGEDRLAFSCLMEVSPQGQVLDFEFIEAVIRVRKFYSYEAAQEAKDKGERFLNLLHRFTGMLHQKRKREGLIDFQFPEPKVELDGNRVPVRIYAGERLASHSWIEECMLLANQVAAQYMQKNGIPGLYRVHEEPDIDEVAELTAVPELNLPPKILRNALVRQKKARGNINPGVQELYVRILEEPEKLPVSVQRKVLQSMKKAQYSAECQGHFALGWLYYAHFTSPIRRYADLWTHRVIKAFLRRHALSKKWKRMAQRVGEAISLREIEVMKVERKGLRTAMAWVMMSRLGEEFVGEISGLESFGIFVTIKEPYAEGLVPVNRLLDDYYEKDMRTGWLVGRRTRRHFEYGQKIRVRLDKADPISSHLDFDFLGYAE